MRNNNLLIRIKAAVRIILRGNYNRRIMTCGQCGSTNIIPVLDSDIEEEIPSELKKKNVQRIWRQIDICQNCGAAVIERQHWVW